MPASESHGIPLRLKRILETESVNEVESRPTFTNNVVLHRLGASVYMDIGIVPIDDILKAKAEGSDELRFVVLDRFVMGLDGFQVLFRNVNQLYDQLKQQGVNFDDAEAESKEASKAEASREA